MNNHLVTKTNIDILAVILDVGLTVDNSAVFQSQVIDQLIALKSMSYKVGILCVYSNEAKFLDGVGKQLKDNEIELFSDKDRGFFRNFIAMSVKLNKLKKEKVISNSYVRGIWGALLLILNNPASPISYLYDVRGDLLDEGKAKDVNYFKISFYLLLEKIVIGYAKHVSAVSSFLKNIIEKRIWSKKNTFVIPSCIDYSKFGAPKEKVLKKRKELGLSKDDVVLLYSGGLSHYQKVPEMLQLWKRLHSECMNIKFILLTNSDPHSLPSDMVGLDEFGPALQVFNLPRSEVFSMLCIADIAFLLRDDRDLNKAASPVKFAEYIASGLAVIGSPNTGDTSYQIERDNIGILMSPDNLDENYGELLELIKSFSANKKLFFERAKKLAKNNYDWQAHRDKFIEIYGLPSSLKGEL